MQNISQSKIQPKPKNLSDPLFVFQIYQIVIALLCVAIPFILNHYDTDIVYPKPHPSTQQSWQETVKSSNKKDDTTNYKYTNGIFYISKYKHGFRASISNYAYTSNSYIFGMLLSIAAMLFVFNGAVHYQISKNKTEKHAGRWYYAVLGLSLLGVICFPHLDRPNLHYFFAILFFFGNAAVMIFSHYKKYRIISIIMGIITIAFLLLTFIKNVGEYYTLLWGEWLSLTVIAIHLVLEAVVATKYDLLNNNSFKYLKLK